MEAAAHPLAEKLRARHINGQGMTVAATAREKVKAMGKNASGATYMVRLAVVSGQNYAEICKPAKPQKAKVKRESVVLNALRAVEARVESARSATPVVREHIRFPVSVVALIVTFALVLAFAVYSEVLISRATGDISEMQSELARQSETMNKLEVSLEKKNDLRVIEQIATKELGMVKKEQADHRYISVYKSSGLVVNKTDSDIKGVGATVMSAFGNSLKELLEYLD